MLDRIGLPSGAQVLEAGCGPGGNFELLQRYGTVSAFDMDPRTVADCRARFDVNCVEGRLPDGHPFHGARRFDLVVALDVIEHVEEDVASLRSLASCLRAGGRLLATVPAYQWMYSAHDRFHHHQRRYRVRDLRSIAEAAGLKVESVGYFNTLLFPPIAASRMLARLRGDAPHSDAGMPPPFVNRMLKVIFGSEAWWLRHLRFPFGTSIFLLAAPPPGGGDG
ncbi:MAG: class I SAM-dependent methyltransferase [Proteobacteria bacterium]|nr:class I SAM-dependent methyltransferase [Pseudomonadota bacterium]